MNIKAEDTRLIRIRAKMLAKVMVYLKTKKKNDSALRTRSDNKLKILQNYELLNLLESRI